MGLLDLCCSELPSPSPQAPDPLVQSLGSSVSQLPLLWGEESAWPRQALLAHLLSSAHMVLAVFPLILQLLGLCNFRRVSSGSVSGVLKGRDINVFPCCFSLRGDSPLT